MWIKVNKKEKLQHYSNHTIYKILGQIVTASVILTDFQKKKSQYAKVVRTFFS